MKQLSFHEAPQRLRKLVNVLRYRASQNGLGKNQDEASFLASLDILRTDLIKCNSAFQCILCFELSEAGSFHIHILHEQQIYLIRMAQLDFSA